MGRDSDVGSFRASDIELRDSLPSKPNLDGDEPECSPKHEPYVSAETETTEISLRALILSGFLAVVLGAANVYLGLFAGMFIIYLYISLPS